MKPCGCCEILWVSGGDVVLAYYLTCFLSCLATQYSFAVTNQLIRGSLPSFLFPSRDYRLLIVQCINCLIFRRERGTSEEEGVEPSSVPNKNEKGRHDKNIERPM